LILVGVGGIIYVVSESPESAEVERLRAANAGLREVIEAKDAQVAVLMAQLEVLSSRLEQLERQRDRDSSNSSKSPSSDSPYTKPRTRSSRTSSGRKPGKQPGVQGKTLSQAKAPDESMSCIPPSCGGCGGSLAGSPVFGVQKRQVVETQPPPPPKVIEYQIVSRTCTSCGTVTPGTAPGSVTGRIQYGPGVHAHAANLMCGHYLPVARAAQLMREVTGVAVSTGFMAAIRAKAAARIEAEFLPHVRTLLRSANVLHADETTGRADGALTYVHVACTPHLTHLHVAGRSSGDIDAGGVLHGFDGVLVRDGYAGYQHLTDADHAWCGAHLLRDLRAFYDAAPEPQVWAAAMATTLAEANTTAHQARAAGHTELGAATLRSIRCAYRGAVAQGLADNTGQSTGLAKDALTLVRRFRDHEDMILRFVTNLAVPWTNNQAERDLRPVKIQMRTSGGCWRTLAGLADFAIVQSYLSTATKWGISKLDALQQLFTTGAWLPPAASPAAT
jgi:transposase